MFLRKLQALGYANAESFNVNVEEKVRHLVVFLEENIFASDLPNIIRALKLISNPEWNKAFVIYLREFKCPFAYPEQKGAVVDWLIREALRLVVEDQSQLLAKVKPPQPTRAEKDMFTNIDWNGQEIWDGVARMAGDLKMPPFPDHFMTLNALSTVLAKLIQARENHGGQENRDQNGENSFRMGDIASGYESLKGTQSFQDACKVLRLLHINQLRQLQTQIDIAVVESQQITANPSTDQQLGQVGY